MRIIGQNALINGCEWKVFRIGLPTIAAAIILSTTAGDRAFAKPELNDSIGRIAVSTIPFDPALTVMSATYTPSGKVLVTYTEPHPSDPAQVTLATMEDDGKNLRPLFSGPIAVKSQSNGLRFMVFPDNRRIFLGDYILECKSSLETCSKPDLVPVDYPAEVASGPRIADRYSEMIVAPDTRHVAWTTLLANYSAMVFVGELQRTASGYKIVEARIVSTTDPFRPDPLHSDGVLPRPILGGEVKQFVHGGTAISMVGAIRRDTPDSVVQDLRTGRKQGITDTPGYTETTIFSPDERLGLTMTTRFSPRSDLAILGLMPRPYPDSLNMGLAMFAYTYSVTGVRKAREGNVGPALIDVQASERQSDYLGKSLVTQAGWIFRSPMSWHPGGTKAMWIEAEHGSDKCRIQVVKLLDYHPHASVAAESTPSDIPGSISDLSTVAKYAGASQGSNVKVYGRKTGYIMYSKSPRGVIDKRYSNYSDDGQSTYSGDEHLEANPMGKSTYTADVKLTGARPGAMNLRMTFGPLRGSFPAQLVFDKDETGRGQTAGFVEYDGRQLDAKNLVQ